MTEALWIEDVLMITAFIGIIYFSTRYSEHLGNLPIRSKAMLAVLVSIILVLLVKLVSVILAPMLA